AVSKCWKRRNSARVGEDRKAGADGEPDRRLLRALSGERGGGRRCAAHPLLLDARHAQGAPGLRRCRRQRIEATCGRCPRRHSRWREPDQQGSRRAGEDRPGGKRRGIAMSVVADAPEFSVPPAAEKLRRLAHRGDQVSEGFRSVAEETAVALSYGGSTHAVMMATPRDLEDFAVGFSLTERIVRHASEIETMEVIPT